MEALDFAEAMSRNHGSDDGLCVRLTPHPADHALVSPDGKLVLVGALGQSTICNFATETGFYRAPAPAACTDARAMTFSADSRYLLIHAADGRVLVWDAARRLDEVVHDFGVRDQVATACTLWGTGRVMAGYGNGAVALMPPIAPGEHDGEQLEVIFQHDHAVSCLQQDARHQRLVSCDQSGRVMVFDRSLSKDTARSHKAHHAAITHAVFSPDGSQLITADGTGRVFVADLAAPIEQYLQPAADAERAHVCLSGAEALEPTMVHDVEQAVTSLTCSADGRWLAVTYAYCGFTLCDLHAGRSSGTYKKAFLPVDAAPVANAAFCADSKYLAVQSSNGIALMFELPHLQRHEAALALAPSGRTVALCMWPGRSTIAAADPTGVWRFGPCRWLFEGGREALQQELNRAADEQPQSI